MHLPLSLRSVCATTSASISARNIHSSPNPSEICEKLFLLVFFHAASSSVPAAEFDVITDTIAGHPLVA